MKLTQAVKASQEQTAYRVVGSLRILIEYKKDKLRVLVQCLNQRHWILTASDGGVRYLNGVRRDIDGSWIVDGCDVAALDNLALCFPTAYQHLLIPESDDWQVLIKSK